MAEIRPPIRYFGSKWRIADWIVARLPPHRVYVEVFGGSAAVLLRKGRVITEVYNDIDESVVSLFRVLRGSPEELARLVDLTPFSRVEHADSFELCDDPMERARRFVVRSWGTRGGYRRTGRSSWWYMRGTHKMNSPAKTWTGVPDRIRGVAQRLQGVHIECADWREVLRRYDAEQTLFYLDPPYVRETRTARWEYANEFSTEDHEELLSMLHELKGMAVLSGYESPLYAEQLASWAEQRTTSWTQSGAARTECLWLSPNAAGRGIQGDLWV